jgi:FkbM family methyltransferase
MNFSAFFKKPEYYFKPARIIHRLVSKRSGIAVKQTPWKTLIEVDIHEVIGRSINNFGIYDVAVSETLWNLIRPGDFVLDIGANIGYTTNLCSFRAGSTGKIWAFEPNPKLLKRLRKNIGYLNNNNVELFPIGLSDSNEEGFLVLPDTYNHNEGVAFIGSGSEGNSISVELKKLDDLIPEDVIINTMKIDVEGHEMAVFKGAERIFNRKGIENIVFEDHGTYPSTVAEFLLKKGYKIYRIEKGWFNVLLRDPYSHSGISYWEPPNYVAVLNEQKLLKQMSGSFYHCL